MDSGDVDNPAGVPLPAAPPPILSEEERREILNAFVALSPVEMGRLKRYARVRMVSVRGRVFHADAEDLLHEALAKTLDGIRKWNRNISFFYHLWASMRSIGNNWYERSLHNEELSTDDPGLKSLARSPNWLIDAHAFIEQLRHILEEKTVARRVLEALMEECTPAEIQALLNITEPAYRAAYKQIRRDAMELLRSKEDDSTYGW